MRNENNIFTTVQDSGIGCWADCSGDVFEGIAAQKVLFPHTAITQIKFKSLFKLTAFETLITTL